MTLSDPPNSRPDLPPRDRSVPRARVNAGDRSIDRRGRVRNAPAFLSYAFRPFFLLGSIYAALAVPLWLLVYFGYASLSGSFAGLAWHAHEMIFGYLGAVIAGFILTAVPNWTGRLPLSGAPLAVLVALWLLGRVALFFDPEPLSAAILDLAFPVVLAASIWREIVAGRNVRNAPIAVLLSLFALANLVDHAATQFAALDGVGIRLALGVTALLMALVGGRVTPSFTRNWLARVKGPPLPAPMDYLDKLGLAATGVGMAGWVAAPDASWVGSCLLGAAALLIARLLRWQGHRTLGEPIVLILHLGQFWLAAALLLMGLAALVPSAVPVSSAVHALTAGAVGTMTLAVMTRASRGHAGRPITAGAATIAIYVLVTLGAALRVIAPFMSAHYATVLITGGVLWSASFGLFALSYGPMLLTKRAAA